MLLLAVSCRGGVQTEELPAIVHEAFNDTASVYYGNFDSYPEDLSPLPIGVFDCSVNGFEVVERLLTMDAFDNITGRPVPDGIVDFGGEHIQFLSDRANGPYGGYLTHDNADYLKEQVLRDVLFLTGSEYYNLASDEYRTGRKEPVKIVLVSSPVSDLNCLQEIDRLLDMSGTGVRAVGVIESGVRDALSRTDEDGNLCVGVLFAPDGISSVEYEAMIRRMASESGLTGKIQVLGQEALGLDAAIKGDTAYIDTSASVARASYVGPVMGISYNNIDKSLFDRYGFKSDSGALLFARNGDLSGVQLNSVENYVRFHLVSMVERHRRSGSRIPISSIVLADGSFCQVMDVMERVMKELYDYKRGGIYLYRSCIAQDFRFVDPGECAVADAYRILREDGCLALRGEKSRLFPFITLPSGSLPAGALAPDGSMTDTFKYGRKCGSDEITTKVVPFSPRYVDFDMMNYIEHSNPATFALIRNSLY